MFRETYKAKKAKYQQLLDRGEMYMSCYCTIITTFIQVKIKNKNPRNNREDITSYLVIDQPWKKLSIMCVHYSVSSSMNIQWSAAKYTGYRINPSDGQFLILGFKPFLKGLPKTKLF